MPVREPPPRHPADVWSEASHREELDQQSQLRLAAMAGHMRQDMVAARRAALVDLLSAGRPFPRQIIWERIEARLGRPCWGKRPEETLWRDLRALRAGGVRIAYSRRSGAEGYYLQHPPIARSKPKWQEPINWQHIAAISRMSVAEKNRQAFAAAAFALRQKRLILAKDHPGWPAERVDEAGRRLVFGIHTVA